MLPGRCGIIKKIKKPGEEIVGAAEEHEGDQVVRPLLQNRSEFLHG